MTNCNVWVILKQNVKKTKSNETIRDFEKKYKQLRGEMSLFWNKVMASPTRWTRMWASSRSWRWSGKPGVLPSMASQRVGHDWATELILILTRISFITTDNMWFQQSLFSKWPANFWPLRLTMVLTVFINYICSY